MNLQEVTSKLVATKAAKILTMSMPLLMTPELWADIKAVAASALTQTPDNPVKAGLSGFFHPLKGLPRYPLLVKK